MNLHAHFHTLALDGVFEKTPEGVVVEELELVHHALDRYVEGRSDPADLVIVGRSHRSGAEPLLPFDRKLGREEGVNRL